MTPLEKIKKLFDAWYEQGLQYSPSKVAGMDRRRLIQRFGEMGLTEGAEIGVDRASFSRYMFQHIPNLHLLCIDPWPLKLRGKSRHISTTRRLAECNATIIRKTSMDALEDVPDESLDFVYIDGNHEFDYVMTDIIFWTKKVKWGGVVAGHDYHAFRRGGVIPAVNVYTYQHGITKWFLTDEKKAPTWFWIREHKHFDPIIDHAAEGKG